MNIIELFQSFQTQERAIDHLKRSGGQSGPLPLPQTRDDDGISASPDRMRRSVAMPCVVARFPSRSGRCFTARMFLLRDWFLVLALMLNAKKSPAHIRLHAIRHAPSDRLEHDASRSHGWQNDPSARGYVVWRCRGRQSYVGGRPRKGNKRDDDTPNSSRGTQEGAGNRRSRARRPCRRQSGEAR